MAERLDRSGLSYFWSLLKPLLMKGVGVFFWRVRKRTAIERAPTHFSKMLLYCSEASPGNHRLTSKDANRDVLLIFFNFW